MTERAIELANLKADNMRLRAKIEEWEQIAKDVLHEIMPEIGHGDTPVEFILGSYALTAKMNGQKNAEISQLKRKIVHMKRMNRHVRKH